MQREFNGPTMRFRQSSLLPLTAAAILFFAALPAQAQSVTFDGESFVNKGLVAVARLPADAKDKQGDTLGGIGSGMAADLGAWKRDGDSYTGTLYMVPDRGWNTEGTLDFQGRLQVFDVKLAPDYAADGPKRQSGLGLTYKDSILLHEADGTPTTGLDPTDVRKAANGFPDLPVANGRVTLDNEGIVHPADGSFWVSDEYGPYVYHYAPDGKLLGAIRPPDAFIPMRKGVESFASNNPPKGTPGPKPANPESGRQNNQGLEGLAIGPDGKHLYALLQSALIQDGGNGGSSPTRFNTRLLAYDISDPAAPKLTGEYVVQLPRFKDPKKGKTLVAAQSELLALNDKQFLLIARDSAPGLRHAGAGLRLSQRRSHQHRQGDQYRRHRFRRHQAGGPGRQARSFCNARRIHVFHRHQRQCPAQPLRPAQRRAAGSQRPLREMGEPGAAAGRRRRRTRRLFPDGRQRQRLHHPAWLDAGQGLCRCLRQGCRHGGAGLSRHFARLCAATVKTQ